MDKGFSQVLRWGMAGWCLIGELGIFFGFYKVTLVSGRTFTLLEGRIPVLADPGLMTVVLAAVGVPLGYFIYQLYYFLFWTVPLGSTPPESPLIKRLIERCDRNRQLDEILSELYGAWADEVLESRLVRWIARPFAKRSGRGTRDVVRFRSSWALSRSAWLRALSRGGEGNVGFALAGERFEYLTSMYDGLGAIMVANWSAWMALLLYNAWRLLYLDGFLGVYHVRFADSTVGLPVLAVLVGYSALAYLVVAMVHRVVWTNRIYLRLSIVTLADSFICQFDCNEPRCLEEERKSSTPVREHDDD